MKNLYLSIITGTGIGLVVLITFLLFFIMPNGSNQQNSEIHSSYENSSDVKIIVNDLNDTYLVGQRINFNLTTISKECSLPHLTLTVENGSMVWTSRSNAMFCDVISASWHSSPWHWRIDSGGLGNLQVNKTGTYKMTIQFLGKTLEKQFSVIPSKLSSYANLTSIDNYSQTSTTLSRDKSAVKVDNTNFTIIYDITGNNNLLNAKLDEKQNSLVLLLETSGNGTLKITVPRALLDSKSGYSNQDTQFIVLIDGREVKYSETTTITARTLTMPFELGSKKIEITAPVNI